MFGAWVGWLAVIVGALTLVRVAAARAGAAPVVVRARDLGGSGLPRPLRRAAQRWWPRTDLSTTPETWIRTTVLWMLVAAPVAAMVGLWLVPVVGVMVIGVRTGVLVQRVLSYDARRARTIPGLIEAVASELRTGASLSQALTAPGAARVPGSELLEPVLGRLGLGASPVEALDAWLVDDPPADVRAVAAVLRVAAERGGQVAPALEHLAAAIRDRHHVDDEMRVQTSQARLSAVIVATAPAGFLLFTVVSDRRTAATLITTTVGRWCLVLGLVGNLAAALVIVRILRDPARRRPRRATARARHARLLLEREVPGCADLIAVLFGAGATPTEVLAGVSRWGPPRSATAFRAVGQRIELGGPLAPALGVLVEGHPPLAPVARSVLAAAHGAPVGALVMRLADDARHAVRRQGELRARRIPVLLLFPLVFMVLPAFMLLSVVPALLAGLTGL